MSLHINFMFYLILKHYLKNFVFICRSPRNTYPAPICNSAILCVIAEFLLRSIENGIISETLFILVYTAIMCCTEFAIVSDA